MKKAAKSKVNWRACLTVEERFFVVKADAAARKAAEAQAEWAREFGAEYPKIRARGVARAKAAAGAK